MCHAGVKVLQGYTTSRLQGVLCPGGGGGGGGGVGSFGEYSYAQNLNVTQATTPVEVVAVTLNVNVAGGLYLLRWSGTWNHNANTTNGEIIVRVDGVIVGFTDDTVSHRQEPKSSAGTSTPSGSGSGSGQTFPVWGSLPIQLPAGAHTITMAVRPSTTGIATLWNALVDLFNLDPSVSTLPRLVYRQHVFEPDFTLVTGTTTNIVAATLTTAADFPAGTYRLGWRYCWNHNDISLSSGKVDANLDGTRIGTVGQLRAIHVEQNNYSGGSSQPTGSGSGTSMVGNGATAVVVALAAGVHVINVLVGTTGSASGRQSCLWNIGIELWEVVT